MLSYKAGIPTGKKCEKCGQGELLERISRHGFFLGCSRYPDCDFIQDLSPELPRTPGEPKIEYCDNCGKEMVIKRGRFGVFLACKGYPDCKTTRRLVEGTRVARQPDEPLDEKCPDCGDGTGEAARPLRRIHRLHRPIRSASTSRPKTLGIACPKCDEGELSAAAAPAKAAAAVRASSTAAIAIRSAISPRRTSPSPSPARSAARRLSWRSAPRLAWSAPA